MLKNQTNPTCAVMPRSRQMFINVKIINILSYFDKN